MTKKFRNRLAAGMPRREMLPPEKTSVIQRPDGTRVIVRERPALSPGEVQELVERRLGVQTGQAVAATDPVLCVMGAPSIAAMHALLDRVAGEVAADPPGRVTHRDNDRLFHDPAANVLDLGTCPWPT